MATNQDAYTRLQTATLNAAAAYAHAKTPDAQNTLLAIYLALDAEMDAMIARDLKNSAANYEALTQQFKAAKSAIDRVVNDTAQFVAATELIAKIASAFAAVSVLL